MKKRIAVYYESRFRNSGPPLYAFNVLKTQMDDKYEVVHLIPNGDVAEFGRFDLNLWVDWGEDALMPNLPYKPMECPKPNAYWVSDTHLGYEYRLSKAREFDYVFCAQERAVKEFKRDGIKNCFWLPHAVEPKAYPAKEVMKKFDVCFIGHIPGEKRSQALDRLFREFPNFFYSTGRYFEEAADIFHQSKIVFNQAIKDDLNMRTYEAMATGSMLLTDRIPTIENFFEDKKHLVLYDNLDDMVEKARYYIDHDEERELIAKAGMKETLAKHTYKHRMLELLKIIKF